ncbi:MAG: hypothetical protein WBA12_00780, partial [Catalinimonas sp.]
KGGVLKRFDYDHWDRLTWRIGYTTVFDLMERLQISGDHHEIARFAEADIDYALFHKSLVEVVGHLNFVHEAWVARTLGAERYQAELDVLPPHLSFVQERYDGRIAALIGGRRPAAASRPLRLA